MTTTTHCPLVIEDDPDTFEWVRRRVKLYGYDAAWARTLKEGIEKLSEHPCCVILDLALPDGSGAEVIRHIRTNKLQIKVAVVSGTDDVTVLSDAAVQRPDAFFKKPVDAIELINWLNSACFG